MTTTTIPHPTRESWLTPAQVAAAWNVSIRFVQEECQRGNLKAKRLGNGTRRQLRITPSQMRLYEETHQMGGRA